MGYVELPDLPVAAGKLHGTIILDQQELQVTVNLLKSALAELTNGSTGRQSSGAGPAAVDALGAHQSERLPRSPTGSSAVTGAQPPLQHPM